MKPKEPATKMSRWWWAGPLLVAAVVVLGFFGWSAWKHHQFEKERTETPPHVVADLKLKLLWIPAGTFVMGTEGPSEWVVDLKERYNEIKPEAWPEWMRSYGNGDEAPVTVVRLTKGFYLGETEVTQARWSAVMGSNPSGFEGPNRPVEKVSWEEGVEFCKKLTERERAAGRISARQAFRLPTEAEWEYACRAGSEGDWCFGNEVSRLGEHGWCAGNTGRSTNPVGTKQANGWGLYDMHGNVWEWCADWYGKHPGGKVSDPAGAGTGSQRVFRGGSWNDSQGGCRSANRFRFPPGYRYTNLGFRIVLGEMP